MQIEVSKVYSETGYLIFLFPKQGPEARFELGRCCKKLTDNL